MKRKSLREKFVTSISFVTLLVLLITLVLAVGISVNLYRESLDESLAQSAMYGQSEVSAWFSDKESMLNHIAEDMRLFDYQEKDEIEKYMSHYAAAYPYLVDVYLGTPDNQMYSGTYWVPDDDYDVRERDWYIRAKSANGMVYTEPYLDAMSGEIVITISMPARDRSGRDLGVMGIDIKLDSLAEYINNSKILNTSGKAFLLDSSYRVIAHHDKALLPALVGDEEVYTNYNDTMIRLDSSVISGGDIFQTTAREASGQKVYAAAITISQNGWVYGFTVPTSDFYSVYIGLILKWIVITLFMVAGSLILTVMITKKLVSPIQAIIEAADKLAQGNVNVDIDIRSNDELEDLCIRFNKMRDSTHEQIQALKRMANGDFTLTILPKSKQDELSITINNLIDTLSSMIKEVSSTANEVNDGARQIADGAQELAAGATKQAAAVEQLNSSMSEVLQQSQENALQARTAMDDSIRAGEHIQGSMQSVQEMMTAMEEINQASQAISKVISVIDNIAFQTNILSLNASVEAARAGEHGKGFAVVASEVRNLAIKSAEAAKGTTDLIQSSIDRVSHGNKIAQQTSESIRQVTELASKNTLAMEAIHNASSRQSEAIEEIDAGIERITAVIQDISATAEESAASSEEMSSYADVLSGLMQRFRTK